MENGNISLHAVPAELINKLKKYDVDGTGFIPVSGVVSALMEARDKNRSKRHLLYAALAFFIAFVMVGMGLTYAVMNLTKESHVHANILTSASSGNAVATARAITVDDLSSNLSDKDLSQISMVKIAFSDNITVSLQVSGYIRAPCNPSSSVFGSCPDDSTQELHVLTHSNTTLILQGDQHVTSLSTGLYAQISPYLQASLSPAAPGRHLLHACPNNFEFKGTGTCNNRATSYTCVKDNFWTVDVKTTCCGGTTKEITGIGKLPLDSDFCVTQTTHYWGIMYNNE